MPCTQNQILAAIVYFMLLFITKYKLRTLQFISMQFIFCISIDRAPVSTTHLVYIHCASLKASLYNVCNFIEIKCKKIIHFLIFINRSIRHAYVAVCGHKLKLMSNEKYAEALISKWIFSIERKNFINFFIWEFDWWISINRPHFRLWIECWLSCRTWKYIWNVFSTFLYVLSLIHAVIIRSFASSCRKTSCVQTAER